MFKNIDNYGCKSQIKVLQTRAIHELQGPRFLSSDRKKVRSANFFLGLLKLVVLVSNFPLHFFVKVSFAKIIIIQDLSYVFVIIGFKSNLMSRGLDKKFD